MKTLREQLQEFDFTGNDEEQLVEKFREIAKSAFYGGYFLINEGLENEYQIYICEVEFYFHSEDDSNSNIHDYAMYHRGKDIEYFPIGSLHPHKSGVDVTFEKENKYRASFLIRQYKVVEKGKDVNVKPFVKPSYLREDLFGYTGCICCEAPKIRWKDELLKDELWMYSNFPRINVSLYDNDANLLKDDDGKKILDKRPWRFTKLC